MTFQVRAKYDFIKGEVSTDFSYVFSDMPGFCHLGICECDPLITEWIASLFYKYTAGTPTLSQSTT